MYSPRSFIIMDKSILYIIVATKVLELNRVKLCCNVNLAHELKLMEILNSICILKRYQVEISHFVEVFGKFSIV